VIAIAAATVIIVATSTRPGTTTSKNPSLWRGSFVKGIEPRPYGAVYLHRPLERDPQPTPRLIVSRHRLLLSILFLGILSLAARAQRPGGGNRPDPKGRIIGRVIHADSKEPAEFASITLLTMNDSVVNGTLAKANGDFALEAVPLGRYTVRISSLGSETLAIPVSVSPQHLEQDLGNLNLQPSAAVLREAEVTAEQSRVNLRVDRRVYNVEKDLSVRGGTGTDVMKNVPGLSVDVDGNVSLRNATPQILIDGRPTTLTLDMIPADDIERVEVITTPSAAFEANTSGGIVNVVLKKSNKPGYSGQVQGGGGTTGRYNLNANLSVKEEPFTFTLGGNLGGADNNTRAETDRTDRLAGEPAGYFFQTGESDNERLNGGGRAGVEWNVTNRNTLSSSVSFNRRNYESDDDQSFSNRDAAGTETSYGRQVNGAENSGNEARAQFGFRRRSPKEGKEWTSDVTWNRSERTNSSDFTTWTYGSEGTDLPRVQHNTGSTGSDQLTLQLDAQDPLNADNKLDWGLRGSWRQELSVLDVTLSDSTGADRYDSTLSNRYDVTDVVNAAYMNWSHKLGERWSVMAGFRVELTDLTAELPTKGERYTYRYPDGTKDLGKALFPSVYLSRKWEGARELQFNVSRKISRPNFFQVMPFIMFSDSRSYRVGNPALGPELTWIAEVNHLLPIGNPRNNWLTSVFTKYTSGVITGYVYPLADDPGVLVSTFVNGDDSWTYGWDNTLKIEPRKDMQITLGATLQYVEVGLGSIGARNSGWWVNGKLNVSQRFAKDWTVQLNGEYEGDRPIPQGHSLPQYGMDASVARDVTKRLNVVAGVNDVFDTRSWGSVYDTPTVYQESYRRRDQRNFRITLTWKFGEQNSSLFRRRNANPRTEPGNTGGEGGDL